MYTFYLTILPTPTISSQAQVGNNQQPKKKLKLGRLIDYNSQDRP